MFEISKCNDKTCEKCGRVYSVESEKGPLREKGEFWCECGKMLNSWHGTTEYSYTLKSGEDKATKLKK